MLFLAYNGRLVPIDDTLDIEDGPGGEARTVLMAGSPLPDDILPSGRGCLLDIRPRRTTCTPVVFSGSPDDRRSVGTYPCPPAVAVEIDGPRQADVAFARWLADALAGVASLLRCSPPETASRGP